MINITNNNHWLIEQQSFGPENSAIYSNGNELSYSELLIFVNQTANYYSANGIKENSHVAIISENNLEFILTVNALWLIGAIAIPINPRLKENELVKLIKYSKSNFVVVINSILENKSFNSPVLFYDISKRKSQENEFCPSPYKSNKTCLMMFTSGSTGFPKCVELTFSNLYHSAKSIDNEIDHFINDIWLASLPFYHIGGFSIITRTIITGCSIVLPSSLKSEDLFITVEKFSPSFISLVPTMFNKIIRSGVKPWEKLKQVFLGGGPVNDDVIDVIRNDKWPISVVYGSTETASMVTICSTSNILSNGISAGIPLKGVEVRIDENRQVIIESSSVAKRYFNLEEENNSRIRNQYYFSNDLGLIDKNKNLKIVGRSDEIVISGGENISLSEIKILLEDKTKFGECILLGIIDEKWGQSYIIVTDLDEEGIQKKIKNKLKENLASFKMPKEISRINKIPRNELGKLQKKEIQILFNYNFL